MLSLLLAAIISIPPAIAVSPEKRAISPKEISLMQPVIKEWLEFEKLDLSKAFFVGQGTIPMVYTPEANPVFSHEFTPGDDSPSKLEMSYSPDKQRYLDMGYYCKEIDGKYYVDWDAIGDGQEIYLIDRRKRLSNLIMHFGLDGQVNDAFWKDNDSFILCGYEFDPPAKAFIQLYDLNKNTFMRFEIEVSDEVMYQRHETEIYRYYYLKKRGIKYRYPDSEY